MAHRGIGFGGKCHHRYFTQLPKSNQNERQYLESHSQKIGHQFFNSIVCRRNFYLFSHPKRSLRSHCAFDFDFLRYGLFERQQIYLGFHPKFGDFNDHHRTYFLFFYRVRTFVLGHWFWLLSYSLRNHYVL